MKRILLLAIVGLALTGCRKDGGRGFVVGTTDAPAPELGTVILAMGQSNMYGMPGASPAIGFADALPQYTVVNCAVGGTYLGQWNIGGPLDSGCVAAVAGRRVRGIIWYQGESDAYLGVANWDQSFTALTKEWRKRWGNVPIVYAQLATADFSKGWGLTWDLIKTQQATLYLPNSRMVVTDDLPRRDDVHLTGDAYMEVGRRMAQAFLSL